ncbi:ABC transporter substrate-binding protein [Candidatus Woesearchaeota archaeon]|nr:ABC transporter substrate-binding protein [Candidatus Woesearchaeota archaeon]|tara:strand:- start:144 stop:1391 length:1248 start_codon:yes stop_codon:yes gene_type:complete
MGFVKSLELALNILLHSRLRSWLTILGIVIGVAAVVAIVSIGEGMQKSIESRLSGLGADLITISPGGGRASSGFRGHFGGMGGSTTTSDDAKNLTKKDILALKSIEGIDLIHGIISGRGEAYYLSEKASVTVEGVDPLIWKGMTTSELESGRFLGASDYNTAVIGSRIAKNTFKQALALNRIITIEDKPFKIIGILKESGVGDDNKIIMPIKAARDTLEDVGNDKFDSIVLKAVNVDSVDQIMEIADERLMISRHLTERRKDYRISSTKAIQESMADITQTMTLFLGAIAAVSLLVGAVGIANTMFTSVLEKTKDIGIMKSIGAKNKDIMMIFLLNSGMVGLVGGLLGIGLGTTISGLMPMLGMRMGPGGTMTTVITPQLLIFSLLFSIFIGMVAGAVPAYRASKLKPVDALRYE